MLNLDILKSLDYQRLPKFFTGNSSGLPRTKHPSWAPIRIENLNVAHGADMYVIFQDLMVSLTAFVPNEVHFEIHWPLQFVLMCAPYTMIHINKCIPYAPIHQT